MQTAWILSDGSHNLSDLTAPALAIYYYLRLRSVTGEGPVTLDALVKEVQMTDRMTRAGLKRLRIARLVKAVKA